MDTVITARVPAAAFQDIQFFIQEEHTDKSSLVRALLLSGLEKKKMEYALEKYQQGEITLGKAGEMLGLPLRKMLLLAAKRGIPFQYSIHDLEKDLTAVR